MIWQDSDLRDSIQAAATRDEIPRVVEWIEHWAQSHGLGSHTAFAMRLCVEEAVTNIVLYGYPPETQGAMALRVASLPNGAKVTLIDRGVMFDVAKATESGREGTIEAATIGGRGIRLMRKFSSSMEYQREAGENRLTLTFLTDAPAPGR